MPLLVRATTDTTVTQGLLTVTSSEVLHVLGTWKIDSSMVLIL
jgi:hypothetical protein